MNLETSGTIWLKYGWYHLTEETVDYFCNQARKAVLAWGEMCSKQDMSDICDDPVKFLEYAKGNLGYDPDVTQNLISTLVNMK